MIKNITKLEYKIGERIYEFLCDNDSPLGEVHDALTKFKEYVVNVIVEREKPKEKELNKEQNNE